MKAIVVLVLATILTLSSCHKERVTLYQAPALRWYQSVDSAYADAKATDALVLLSFEAAWCPWSRLQRGELYSDSTVIDSLRGICCVRIDADRSTNLCDELGINVFPTVVLTDAYGSEIGRIIGYHEPEVFLAKLDEMKTRSDRLSSMFKREEHQADDPYFLLTFGRMLMDMGIYDGALLRFEKAGKLETENQAVREEVTYSMAECYMLAGKFREAGRRFRIFAREFPESDRAELALILSGLCYERAGYRRVAKSVYQDYLRAFEHGSYTKFVSSRIDSLG